MGHCNHPLDHLYPNNSLLLLEALIPYVDSSLQLPLALLIKFQEIQFIVNSFSKPNVLKACGFDSASSNPQDMIFSICNALGYTSSDQLSQIKNMQAMMQQMQQSTQVSPSCQNIYDTQSTNDDFSYSRDEMLDAIREILNEQSN